MEEHDFSKCKRCNKPLKSKIARNRGYGEVCWQIYLAEIKKTEKSVFKNIS